MAIVVQSQKGRTALDAEAFGDEAELEQAVAESPALLQDEGDPPLALVQRQVSLPDAGLLDVLLVDANGVPVAAEVKLARNGESRRQIVAQIVDYVASLTGLTVDELDALVREALEDALRSFDSEDGDESRFEQRWQSAGANLRAGLARIVLVLDDAPDDLVRIVRFLAQHSDFDIRLVTVSKYRGAEGCMFVPRMLVSRGDVEPGHRGGSTAPAAAREELMEVVAAYDSSAPNDMRTTGRAPRYRQIRPQDWPTGTKVHYEFVQSRDTLSVDLHLESDKAARLAPMLQKFAGTSIKPTEAAVEWDPAWNSNRGRLRVRFPLSQSPSDVAETMAELIRSTRGEVAAALSKIGGSSEQA